MTLQYPVEKLSATIERKFVDIIPIQDYSVETDTGYYPVSSILKTVEYEIFELVLKSGQVFRCANTHILFDEDMNEIFAKDTFGKFIQTKNGPDLVISVKATGVYDNMYDISVESDDHRYYTSDILSHNTTSIVASVVHYILFNENKTVAILANKADTAREIMNRIQKCYENLPKWMQHGVNFYNKGSFELENGSKVLAAASSSSAIRGHSISFLLLDEAAHVDGFDEFWSSVYPTISSGEETKVVMISTPNGYNHFHGFWQDANESVDPDTGCGQNGFYPIKVTWRDIPERNNKEWELRERLNLGDAKFEQEHECVTGDTIVTILYQNGTIQQIDIKSLSLELGSYVATNKTTYIENTQALQILTPEGFKHFAGIQIINDTNKAIVHIKLKDGRKLKCSIDHQIDIGHGFTIVSDIDQDLIESITPIESEPLYDPVGVSDVSCYISNGIISHNCSFLGSIVTLVSPSKLMSMKPKHPVYSNDDLRVYEASVPSEGIYVLIADVSHGKGLDDHAFSVVRIDKQPFLQVASFKNNMISPIEYAELIWRTAQQFNEAYVLVELNDMGVQVARVLTHDLEYENVIHTTSVGRKGQVPCYPLTKAEPGVRTSKTTKAIGCNMLKHLLEHDKLVVQDRDTIAQLTTFIRSDKVNESFSAQSGSKDDCVMPLVLFGWFSNSEFFTNFVDIELRNMLRKDSQEMIDEMFVPMGHLNRGAIDVDGYEKIDNDKDHWTRSNHSDFFDYKS